MIGTFALFAAALVATAPPQRLEALGWMSGSWRTLAEPMRAGGPNWREEIWSSAEGSPLMVGISRGQRGFGRFTYEHLRIAQDERAITLHVQEIAGPAVRYRLVGSSANEAVFESAAPANPQRIAYRRDGDVLTITGSRLDGQGAYSREYRRSGSGDRSPAGN